MSRAKSLKNVFIFVCQNWIFSVQLCRLVAQQRLHGIETHPLNAALVANETAIISPNTSKNVLSAVTEGASQTPV
jgi:hypothetical protein